jgi:ATP-dependent Clp protease ATP-binding subunit ClpA
VLLLDEIEKAHPDIFNVLLQVMDHGTLTDNNGRKADFRNVIIIMTTNAGAETMNKATIGFTNPREAGDEMADIKRLFTPEFRNRLDAIVSFKALDEKIILRVVDKFLLQLETQLAEKKVEVTFTDKLRKHLAKKGFDPLMGARPMQRLIQDTIRRALADELLFGRLTDGGRLTVDIKSQATEPLVPSWPLRNSTRISDAVRLTLSVRHSTITGTGAAQSLRRSHARSAPPRR